MIVRKSTNENIWLDRTRSALDLIRIIGFVTEIAAKGRATPPPGTRPRIKPKPKPPNGEEAKVGARNRRAILRAATVQFSQKGFEGTTIDNIASEAKLPRANVYYYFASKVEIYRAILGKLISAWDTALDCITADAEPEAALAQYVAAKLDHARRHTVESRLFALEILGGARFLTRADRVHMRSTTQRGTTVVEGWIAAGKLRPIDPRHLFILLWSATQFYADFSILAADALGRVQLSARDFDCAAEVIVSVVLHGIQARDPATLR